MAEDQAAGVENAQGDQQDEPDYKSLYESSQEELRKAKENSRKWEERSKANAEKAKAYDASQEEAKTVEERLAALERENTSLKASKERADTVARVAKATGLEESLVSMLSGEDEESLTQQAEGLKSAIGSGRRYPTVGDQGGATPPKKLTEEDIAKIKNPAERVRARAELIHNQFWSSVVLAGS